MIAVAAKKTSAAVKRTAVLDLSDGHLSFGVLEQGDDAPRFAWKRVPIESESQGRRVSVDEASLRAALKTFVQEGKLQGAPLHVVLGGDYCVTRVVAGNREHVQRELRQLQNRSGLYLSLGHGPKAFAESVVAIDAKRAQGAITVTNERSLNQVLQASTEAGLKVASVEHSLVTLCRAIGRAERDADSPVLIVEIHRRGLDLGVSYRGRLLLDYRPGGVGDHRQRADLALKHLGRIQRYCLRNFQFTSSKITQVILCGEGPEAEQLRRHFETAGGLRAEILDPAEICPEWRLDKSGPEQSWLVPALGALATKGRVEGDDGGSPDLMTPLRLLQRSPLWPGLAWNAWPIAAALLLTLGLYGLGWWEGSRVARLEAAAASAVEGTNLVTETQRKLHVIDTKIKHLGAIEASLASTDWGAFLADVAGRLPEGTWLEGLKVDKEGVVALSGPSYSENSVYELIERLKEVPNVSNVALEGTRTGRMQGGPVTLFDVKAVYKYREAGAKRN